MRFSRKFHKLMISSLPSSRIWKKKVSTVKLWVCQPTNSTYRWEIWSQTTPMAPSWSPHGDGKILMSSQDNQPVFALTIWVMANTGPAGNTTWIPKENLMTLRATWSTHPRGAVLQLVLIKTLISAWNNSQPSTVHGSAFQSSKCSDRPTLTAWDSCQRPLLLRTHDSKTASRQWLTWLLAVLMVSIP